MAKDLAIINLYLAILQQKHNEHNVTKNPIKKYIFILVSK